jgi:APA family basic amino acid/polyamine antiporter
VSTETSLERAISLPLLVLYGVGTTIGAGIFVLTGEVAGRAGFAAPLAFVLASLLAGGSALGFAELSSRIPESAGEAAYVRAGFGSRHLAAVVGLMVALAGIVSAATLARSFGAHLEELLGVPAAPVALALALALGSLAAWGIRESAWVAGVITLVSIGGLLAIVVAARGAFAALPQQGPELWPGADVAIWSGVVSGAVLAFYAFLGFEDMVNIAEEVVDVRRVLPRAIVVTLLLTTLLYALVSVTAVLAVPPARLAESDAPLVLVWREATGRSGALVAVVSLVSLVNGALVQVVMSSRVLYGLARRSEIPFAALGRVHVVRRTPAIATLLVTGFVALLAVAFPVVGLAETTALLTLGIFALVNAALLRIKRLPDAPTASFHVPTWVPATAVAVCVLLAVSEGLRRFCG